MLLLKPVEFTFVAGKTCVLLVREIFQHPHQTEVKRQGGLCLPLLCFSQVAGHCPGFDRSVSGTVTGVVLCHSSL